MKRKLFLSIIFFIAGSIIIGCVHMNRTLTVPDVEGIWEGVYLDYCYLDIRKNGKGYLIFLMGNEAIEAYEITNISFLKGPFIISLQKHGEKDEKLKVKGLLLGEYIILLNFEKGSKEPDKSLYFIRESSVPERREKAKEIVREIQERNT